MLFWTELKLVIFIFSSLLCFRVVLFWTELKPFYIDQMYGAGFRVVLFWTELKPLLSSSFIMAVLELCYFGLN